MQKSAKFNFLDFVKKIDKNFRDCHLQSNMDADSKMLLKITVTESYKHNSKKGNVYTYKNFKNGGVFKARIWKVKIQQLGINQNIEIKKGMKT